LHPPRRWLVSLAAIGLASGVAGGAAVAWLGSDRDTVAAAESARVSLDAVPLNRLTVAPLVARVAAGRGEHRGAAGLALRGEPAAP
jgi:serine protease DegQ